jgi:putative ABC transport system permease protein
MTPAAPAPPRWAERLARIVAGRPRWDDALAGDLREEFAAMCTARGHAVARRWYRRQVAELARDGAALGLAAIGRALKSLVRPTGDPPMRSLLQDLRPAVRALRRQPLSAVVIVVTLAIGLGTNAAVLGMADALVLRPFPFQGVDDLVAYAENSADDPYPQETVAPANFREWAGQAASFTAMAAFSQSDVNMAGAEQAERVGASIVSGAFFAALAIQPIHGRLLDESDQTYGSHRQTVLGHALWQRRFGGDAGIVGRTIQLDGDPHTVVGIAPAGFDFPAGSELWIPLGFSPDDWADRRSHFLTVFARLRPGVTYEEAAAEMATIYDRQRQAHPEETRDRQLTPRTFSGAMIDFGLPRILVLWQAAALFVLLIGCANIANLLLARGAERRRELAVRVAIGASRAKLVRQLLVESLLIAVVASPAALLVAALTFGLLRGAMPPELVRYLAGWLEMGVDLRLAVVTLGFAAATSVVFGLLPALQASRAAVGGALKEGGRSVTASRHRLRRGLVVAEIALALPLLVSSGMAALGARQFASGPQGYDPEGLLRVRLVLPTADYADGPSRRLAARRILEEAQRLPGVQGAATSSVLPSSSSNMRRELAIDGRPLEPGGTAPIVSYRSVSPGYLRVMRIPLLQGRSIEEADRENTEPVAVISQAMAARFWPGESPIGARIRLGGDSGPWATVVGIAGDTIDDWFSGRNQPTVYVPVEQAPTALVNIALRTAGDPAALADGARRAVSRVDPALAPFDVTTMTDAVRIRTTGIRFIGGMMAAFGIIALVLAAIGIYSVVAYMVSERRQEIGIRMALGATSRSVLVRMAGSGGRMALVGISIGLGLGVLLARAMESALWGVVRPEVWLFAAIAAVLAVVAVAASLVPARQASHVDPIVALRTE